MPLPMSHSLAGLAIYAALDRDPSRAFNGKWLVAAVLVANLPDLDFVPGLLVGDPNRYHQQITHTLLFATVLGLLAALGACLTRTARWRSIHPGYLGLGVTLLCTSHIVLDALTKDNEPPVGVPLLWPLLDRRVQFAALFPNIDRMAGEAGAIEFLVSVLTVHNLAALAIEFLALAPVVALSLWWRRRQARR